MAACPLLSRPDARPPHIASRNFLWPLFFMFRFSACLHNFLTVLDFLNSHVQRRKPRPCACHLHLPQDSQTCRETEKVNSRMFNKYIAATCTNNICDVCDIAMPSFVMSFVGSQRHLDILPQGLADARRPGIESRAQPQQRGPRLSGFDAGWLCL